MTPRLALLYYPYYRKPVPSGVELDKLACTDFLSLYLRVLPYSFMGSRPYKNQFKDLAVLVAVPGYAPSSRGNESRMVTRPPYRHMGAGPVTLTDSEVMTLGRLLNLIPAIWKELNSLFIIFSVSG